MDKVRNGRAGFSIGGLDNKFVFRFYTSVDEGESVNVMRERKDILHGV